MWRSLPKAAKELEVGEAWLRGEILKAYNFPLDSAFKINVHWRMVGSRYQINTEKFPEVLKSQYPQAWERTVKQAIKRNLKKEGVFIPGLEDSIFKAVMEALSDSQAA
jgi:hypothetical protein